MTTHTLSDGTQVPAAYDFNVAHGELPVHNQGQNPICYYEGHATLLEAFAMLGGKRLHLDPQRLGQQDVGVTAKEWTDERTDTSLGVIDYAGDNVWNLDEYKGLASRKEVLIKALLSAQFLEGGVICAHSFDRLWLHPGKYAGYDHHLGKFQHLPVLHMLPGDLSRTWAHEVVFPGYHWDHGLLVQNSWGNRFGLHGRAYIGWDMVDAGAVSDSFLVTWRPTP